MIIQIVKKKQTYLVVVHTRSFPLQRGIINTNTGALTFGFMVYNLYDRLTSRACFPVGFFVAY